MNEKPIDRWARRNRGRMLMASAIAAASLAVHIIVAARFLYDVWPVWAIVTLTVSFVLTLVGPLSLLDEIEERHQSKAPRRQAPPADY